MKKAIFTIISKNYLALARTLMDSVLYATPDYDRYVLLVDEIEEKFDPKNENFELVSLKEINLPKPNKMIFRYNILELNTAVKPWMYEWMLNKGYDFVYYIDPDIYIYERLIEVEELLTNGYSIVLTPHLTGTIDDEFYPSELDIMRSGTFNLGFLALANTEESYKLLKWWQTKLEYECLVDLERGLFVDQKWMDYAPSLFNDVYILRHEGYNVAYWNLNHRKLNKVGNKFYVNNDPLRFFHFSGLNPLNLNMLSKHQNRFKVNDLGDGKELVKDYAKKLIGNGYEECIKWSYYYNRFEDNIRIIDFMRKAYNESEYLQSLCGDNPFRSSEYFIKYNYRKKDNEKKNLLMITPLMYGVWLSRSDLQEVFPDVFEKDREAFYNWFLEKAESELNLDKEHYSHLLLDKAISTNQTQSVEKKIYKNIVKYEDKLKPFLKRVLPKKYVKILKNKKVNLLRKAYNQKNIKKVKSIDNNYNNYPEGINLIGYVRSEMGVGQACRMLAKCLDNVDCEYGIYNFTIGDPNRKKDFSLKEKEIDDLKYNINILHINADQTLLASNYFGDKMNGRYSIGYWAWELPDFPNEWVDSFDVLNEVWVPSRFVLDSISEKANVPTYLIPHAIELNVNENITRKDFGLPEDKFLFLCMYDVHSYSERKNPRAAIQAFKKAFSKENKQVGLVIKVNNAHNGKKDLKELKEQVKDYDNVYFITEILTREYINALINNIDVFISLHRSEGFGLVLAEAMYMGKAVIATNWSGNTDFMNYKNSCPVDYKLVQLGRDIGPYKAYQYWAEPDIDDAVRYMRRLFNDREYYKKISEAGKKTIREEFNPEVIGRKIEKRLKAIGFLGGIDFNKEIKLEKLPKINNDLKISVDVLDKSGKYLNISGWILNEKEIRDFDNKYIYFISDDKYYVYQLNSIDRIDVNEFFNINDKVKLGYTLKLDVSKLDSGSYKIYLSNSIENGMKFTNKVISL